MGLAEAAARRLGLEHLSAEVIEASFATIEAALPSLDAGPQYETSELLVFQR